MPAEFLVARMRRYSGNDVQELLHEILMGENVDPEEQSSAIADAMDLCMVVQELLASETSANMATSKTITVTFEAKEDGKIKIRSHSQEGEREVNANEVMEVRNHRGYIHMVKRRR